MSAERLTIAVKVDGLPGEWRGLVERHLSLEDEAIEDILDALGDVLEELCQHYMTSEVMS